MLKPCAKASAAPFLQIGLQLLLVEVGLELVRHQDHDDVRPGRGLGGAHHLEARAFGLGGGRRARPQRHHDLGHAAVLEVVGMAEALAAIADHGHALALDQVQIGVGVVVDAHRAGLRLDLATGPTGPRVSGGC